MKTSDLYLKFDDLYKEKDFFDKLEVIIEVVIPKIEERNESLYKIKEIKCNKHTGNREELKN